MTTIRNALIATSALATFTSPVYAQELAANTATASDIVVTARRQAEVITKVPIAVTAISQDTLSAHGTYSVHELQKDVPGLTVTGSTSDRNNVTYSIRGQGYAYGTLFPAVITYVNEVPVAQFTTGQFFDLSDVQVLRGPQGVMFGRVTDGGNIMVNTKRPTDEFGGSLESRYGNLNMWGLTAVLNVPLIADKLMIRGAAEVQRRDGYTHNIATGNDIDNVAYETYRLGVLIRPVEGIENYTTVQFQRTHDDGTGVKLVSLNDAGLNNSLNGLFGATGLFSGGLVGAGAFVAGSASAANPSNAPLASLAASLAAAYKGPMYGLDGQGNVVGFGAASMVSPLTTANYIAMLHRQLAREQTLGSRTIDYNGPNYDRRKNFYITNVTDIDLSDSIQLRNVLGYIKATDKEASNFVGSNGNLIATYHGSTGLIPGTSPEPGADGLDFYSQEQISEELRISGKSFANTLSWSLGFYYDRQKPATLQQNDTVNVAVLQRINVPLNKTSSKAVYGAFEFDASSLIEGLKINGGLRYTWDSVNAQTTTYLRPLSLPIISGGTTITPAQAFAPVIQSAMYLGSNGAVIMTDAQALAAANATFAPIPHGQCSSYGGPIFSNTCATFDQKFEAFTWSGGLSYQASESSLLYAKMSKGYRPGGVQGSTSPGFETYQPEFDYSIELGAKSRFDLGGMSGRASLALFRDRYKGIQKLIAVAGAGGTPVSIITNAAAATIKGAEFEGTLVPVPGLTLAATAAYTDAKYDSAPGLTLADIAKNPTSPCNPANNTIVGFCTDNRFANTPEFQFSLAGHYEMDLPRGLGSLRFGGRYYHQSSLAMTDFSTLGVGAIEPAYGLLDLDARWSRVGGQPIDIGLFMNNVTNKLYRSGNNNLNYAASIGTSADYYAAPRTYGIALKYTFGGEVR